MSSISSVRSSRARRRHTSRLLEALEPRTLLSAAVSSYTLTDAAAGLGAYDSAGALWVYDLSNGSLERVTNGAVDTASAIPLDFAPWALAGGPNGHIYAADQTGGDGYGAIVDINTTAAANWTTTTPMTSADQAPVALTVTGDGAVWFVGVGTISGDATSGYTQQNVIGRIDPATGTLTAYTMAACDSSAFAISASGADAVWIGLRGLSVNGSPAGTNRLAAASWNGAFSLATYDVVIPGSDAGANGYMQSLVSGRDGNVWFTLSNAASDTGHATHCVDQIVHGTLSEDGASFAQTAYIDPLNSVDTPLNYSGLAVDAEGHVWFIELEGNQFGVLDPSVAGGVFTLYDNPTATSFYQSTANKDGTQISLLNTTDIQFDDQGNLLLSTPIIQIDVTASGDIAVDLTDILATQLGGRTYSVLAEFTDDPDLTHNTWTTVINWDDGSTSTGAIIPDNDSPGDYLLRAVHHYSVGGTYEVTVTISTINALGDTVSDTITAIIIV